ncbi:unnamed protein product, partial [marine sediment metagenome]
ISLVGEEEAGKLIKKARYDDYYERGRALAEKLGNPKDLDSYVENVFIKSKSPVWVAPGYFAYRTKNKAVYRTSNWCFKAESLKKFVDKEMLEFLAEYYCVHDGALANGFNPDMKWEMTKNFLRGDDCCEFTFEV